MKRISTYLKMRVLGAIDFAEGASIQQRIKTVSQMTFHDEDHVPHQFTWRTIQTWLTRYKKHGLTELKSRRRSDTGKPRKVTPEQLLEAIEQVKPLFREKSLLPRLVYKACVEKGLLRPEEVSKLRSTASPRSLICSSLKVKPTEKNASPSPRPTPTTCGRPTPFAAP